MPEHPAVDVVASIPGAGTNPHALWFDTLVGRELEIVPAAGGAGHSFRKFAMVKLLPSGSTMSSASPWKAQIGTDPHCASR